MRVFIGLMLVLALGCGGDPGVDSGAPVDAGPSDAGLPPARDPWPSFPVPSGLEGPLVDEEPWLLEANRWRTEFDVATGTPDRTRRGGFGIGNGHVFGFVGIGEPDLATIHEAVGPGYEKHEGYFSDVQLAVRVGGERWEPVTQYQWQIRSTAVVVTLTRGPGLDLWAVDFAPLVRPAWADPSQPEERALVRHVAARATGGAALVDVEVALVGVAEWTAEGDVLVHRRDGGARIARLDALAGETDGEALEARFRFARIEPGAAARGTFAIAIGASDADVVASLSALEALPAMELARTTRDAWRAWAASGATLRTPEPMVDDLVETSRIMLRVQQAATGATCPMSEYTRTWLRDTIGPVLAMSALGHHEEAEAMMTYVYRAILDAGDLRNSMSADLDLTAPAPTPPDFRSLGPLSGTVRAEGPSYLVMGHDELARWTGDRAAIDERFDLFWHALTDQALTADDLLPFSGDETYRTAMAIGTGFDIAEQFTEGFLSSDSSFLLAVAAERLAAHAEVLGRNADADALRALAMRVRTAADALYWNEAESFYAPFATDPERDPWDAPFEDVSTKPVWTGYLAPDDPRARPSVQSVWDLLGNDERGMPITYVHPRNATLLRSQRVFFGVHTGMTVGYFLGAASAVDLPEAEAAFDALGRTANTTGSWSEYMTFEDHANLSLTYDTAGLLGEYTARYRPWEGGINVRALLDYLGGVSPALDPEPHLVVAPHLPTGWDRFELADLRVADARITLVVEDEPTGADRTRRTTVTVTGAAAPVALDFGVRVPASEIISARAGGVDVDPGTLTLDVGEGRVRFELPRVAVSDGASHVVEIRYRPSP